MDLVQALQLFRAPNPLVMSQTVMIAMMETMQLAPYKLIFKISMETPTVQIQVSSHARP